MSTLLYNKKANGKLLLTGEYFVLDGAKAIACPTKYGQTLTVNSSDVFSWKSYDHLEHIWLEITGNRLNTEIEKKLLAILHSIDGFSLQDTYEIRMDFPRDWGLGSSSTLIALLADYFQVNPFELNHKIFKGSGYDIACAFSETPILYSNDNKHAPSIESIQISENIKPYCYFAYLNKKQDSREGINLYRKIGNDKTAFIQEISSITEELIKKQNLEDWIYLLGKHEEIISSSLSIPRAADTVLKGLPFFSKSLGAWGGDFVMIVTDEGFDNVKQELSNYSLRNIFPFSELLV
jgi:mevalonate kinase